MPEENKEEAVVADILSEGDRRAEEAKRMETPAKSLDDLHSKFSARDRMSGLPQQRQPEKREVKTEDKQEDKNGEQKPDQKTEVKPEVRKEPAFVKKVVGEKKAAESELAETKTKLEKFEKEEKPKLESQIAELQKKIDSGELSTKKAQEYEAKLQKLESEFVEKEQSLVNENKAYKERLELLNMQESEGFQKEYVEPVKQSFRTAMQILGSDEKKQKLLHRALVSNSASLSATTEEDRAAAEAERDEALSAISEELPKFSQGRFDQTMGAYIDATQRHAAALSDGQKTAIAIKEKEKADAEKARNQIIENWGRAYKVIGDEFSEDADVPEDLKTKLKESEYEQELQENESIAKRVVTGRGSMNESIKMIHQGRVYPVLKAKLEAKDKLIKDLRETIAKQRGSGTSSEDNGTSTKTDGKPTNREEWERKFSANRPGIRQQARE